MNILTYILMASMSGYMSGNDLLALCRANDTVCTAYISGVVDMQLFGQSLEHLPKQMCPAATVTAKQMADIVRDSLSSSDRLNHLPAASLVVGAASEAFPCPE